MIIDSLNSSNGSSVLKFSGGLTFAVQKNFQEAINEARTMGTHSIVLDLEKVSYIDSAGLALIMIAHRNLKEKNIQLSLSHLQDYVRKVFDLANVHKIIPIL